MIVSVNFLEVVLEARRRETAEMQRRGGESRVTER